MTDEKFGLLIIGFICMLISLGVTSLYTKIDKLEKLITHELATIKR